MKGIFTKIASVLAIGGALSFSIPVEAQYGGGRGYRGSYGGHDVYRGGRSHRSRDFAGYGRHRFYRGGYRDHGYAGYPAYYGHRGYPAYRYRSYPTYGYGYGYGYRYYDDSALALGLLGVALGAALGSRGHDRYYDYEPDFRYQDHAPPPHATEFCPDGSAPSAEGYCPDPPEPQPLPESDWGSGERG